MFNQIKTRAKGKGLLLPMALFFAVFISVYFFRSPLDAWFGRIRTESTAATPQDLKSTDSEGKVKGITTETQETQDLAQKPQGEVKAVVDDITENSLVFRIKVFFLDTIGAVSAKFDTDLEVGNDVIIGNDLDVGGQLTLAGDLVAPNVLYSLAAGTGVTISGDQEITITNNDLGSDQEIFKNFRIGDTTISAGSNDDTLTWQGGTGILLSSDGKTVTVSASGSDLNVSGFTDGGSSVYLTTSTDNVGIGTSNPGYKLHVVGTSYFSGNATFAGGTVISSGINNSSGGITNAGPITGATGLTSSGTITFSGLGTGIVHSNVNGVISSSALNLAGGGTEITGTLPVTNGGTGLTSATTGQIMYASAANTFAALGIGSEGQVLTVSSGIPAWGSSGAGSPCATCIVNNPGSTQTITPAAATATGLVVKQAASGSVDVFRIESNDGSNTFFKIDSSGNVTLGSQTSSGVFTVSPSSTDPISISPVAEGVGQYTGTITSEDLTAARTWTFPNESGIICLASGNCSGTAAGVGGSGTTNYLSRWSSTYGLTDSIIYDSGTNIGIGSTSPGAKLDLVGTFNVSGFTTLADDLQVNKHATISGSLTVDQTVDFNSTLGVTGATTLGSTLDVTGVSTFGGNVGIGTTAPGAKLEIESTITDKVILDAVSDNLASRILFNQGSTNLAYVGTGTGNSDDDLILNASDNVRFDAGGATAMTLLSGGNLGIGTTTNSTSRLRVVPAGNSSGMIISGYSLTSSASDNLLDLSGTWNTTGTPKGIYLNVTNTASGANSRLMQLQESEATRFAVYPSGNVDLQVDSSSISNAGMSAPGLAIINTNTTTNNYSSIKFGDQNNETAGGISFQHTDHVNNYGNLHFVTRDSIGLSERMTILSGGNVGIGTNLPTARLQIVGDEVRIGDAGTVTYATGDGELYVEGDLEVDGQSYLDGRINLLSNVDQINSSRATFYGFNHTGSTLIYNTQGQHWWRTNDLTRMILANNGYFGIGGSTPVGFFNVEGAATGKALAILNETGDQDIFVASASGTNRFTIKNNGNIGIGTTNPLAALHIGQGTPNAIDGTSGDDLFVRDDLEVDGISTLGTTTFAAGTTTFSNGVLRFNSNGEYLYLQSQSDDGIHFALGTNGFGNNSMVITTQANRSADHGHNTLQTNPTVFIHSATAPGTSNLEWGSLSFEGTGSGGGYFNLTSGVGDLALSSASGNVGIGTTAPVHALEVNGNVALGQFLYHSGDTDTYFRFGTDQWQIAAGGAGFFDFSEGATDIATFNYNNADIDFSINGDTNNGIFFVDGALERIGIGTTTPAAKLDIIGDLRVNGAATVSASAAGNKALVVKAATSQTANLLEIQDSSGTKVAAFDNYGFLNFAGSSTPNTWNTVLQINNFTVGSSEYAGGFGNGFLKLDSTGRSFLNLVTDNTTNSLLSGGVNGENYRRFAMSGAGTWQVGGGSGAQDTILERISGGGWQVSTTGSNTALSVSGNLGIGTTTSSNALTIQTGNTNGWVHTDGTVQLASYLGPSYGKITTLGNHALRLGFNNTVEVLSINTTAHVGIQDVSPEAVFEVTGTGTSDDELFMVSSVAANDGDIFTVRRNGNVGIGSNTPIGLLNVNGAATGKALTILNETGDQDIFVASASGTNRFTIKNDGNVGIGTTSPGAKLNLSSGSIKIGTSDCNNSFCLDESGFHTGWDYTITNHNGGSLLLMPDANVGIGTTTANAKLDVNGTIYFGTQIVARGDTDTKFVFGNNQIELQGGGLRLLTSSMTASFTGNVTGNLNRHNVDFNWYGDTNSEFFTLDAGVENVGIGTATPGQKLDVVGSARFSAVGSGTYSNDLNLTSDGTLTTSSSDIRLKENLVELTDSEVLSKVLQLQTYTFDWKQNGAHDYGMVAQEVAQVFPQITFTNKTDGFMGINYSRVPTLLVSAVQEQQRLIDSLRLQIGGISGTNVQLAGQSETSTTEAITLQNLISEFVSFPDSAWTFVKEVVFTAQTKFMAKVSFMKQVVFKEELKVNSSTSGSFIIPLGTKKAKIAFDTQFSEVPTVYLSPQSQVVGGYSISSIDETGFVVSLNENQTTTLTFDWLALLSSRTQTTPVTILEEFTGVTQGSVSGVSTEQTEALEEGQTIFEESEPTATEEADLGYSEMPVATDSGSVAE